MDEVANFKNVDVVIKKARWELRIYITDKNGDIHEYMAWKDFEADGMVFKEKEYYDDPDGEWTTCGMLQWHKEGYCACQLDQCVNPQYHCPYDKSKRMKA